MMVSKPHKMKIPTEYMDFVKEIKGLGIESYFVGGCIRDSLLGLNSEDYDIFLKCTKEHFKDRVEEKDKDYLILYDFDNVIILKDEEFNEMALSFNDDFSEDINSRDITINALYYNWETKEVFGLDKSFNDLEEEVITACNEESFYEDSLKMIRALRFGYKLDFMFDIDIREVFEMELEDIDSEFSASRLRAEYIKNNIEMLSEYGLNYKIVNKLMEFEIIV